MIIVYFIPRGVAQILRVLAPIVIVSLLIVLVTTHAYHEFKLEHWYQSQYGEDWQKRYDQEHVESISQEHNKITVGGVGILVVVAIAGLIYRQLAKALNNGHDSGGWKSSRRSSPTTSARPESSRGRSSKGKMWLIVMFCALRAIDLLTYFEISSIHRTRLWGVILVSAIWTTALLIGIWKRMNWARYFLIAILLLGIGLDLIAITNAQVFWRNYNIIRLPLTIVAVRLLVVWFLAASADIRRLCSRR